LIFETIDFQIFTFGTFCFMSRVVEMIEGRLSSKNWNLNDNLWIGAGVVSYVYFFTR